MKTKSITALLFAMSCASSSAFAYTTDIADATRTFTFDSTSFFSGSDNDADTLLSYGKGNITGNVKNGKGNVPAGWQVTVDGSQSTYSTNVFSVSSLGASSGTFSLSSNVWDIYSRIAIGFKVGSNKSIDWAIFELEQFAQSGIWSTGPKQGGGLSHYMVYTIPNSPVPPSQVPVPGAAWLFLTGILGLMARKKSGLKAS